jgi:hypothetical protein
MKNHTYRRNCVAKRSLFFQLVDNRGFKFIFNGKVPKIPVGATAFAFAIVKSPIYEFTNSNFTIATRGPHKVIGISYAAFLQFVGWSSNRKEIHPRKNHNR